MCKLRVLGPNGKERQIEAIIDSGFTGSLTLPRSVVASLGLVYQGFFPGLLADGSEQLFDLYSATVMWDRRRREVEVVAAEGATLAGMSLLTGYEVTMQVWHGAESGSCDGNHREPNR